MKYYKQLDALRCYSVFWVVFGHLPIVSLGASLQLFFSFLPGVQIFFAISGFLITSIVLQNSEFSVAGFLRSFYMRRFLRIFPIYYLIIFLLFCFNIENYRSTWFLYDLFYISNIKMGLLGSFDSNQISPHFWSLAVEEQFYLFWPGLLLFARNRTQIYILAFLLFGLGVYLSIFNNNFFTLRTLGNLSYLGSGCILGILFYFNSKAILSKTKVINIVFLISIIVISVLAIFKIVVSGKIAVALTIFLIPIIVLKFIIGFKTNVIKAVLENPIIVYLGKISYGIYVYHFFALFPLLLIKKLSGLEIFQNETTASIFKILITILLSVISWEFFEKKINRLKKRFDYTPLNTI